jgi:CubicO group peptidase (beta-lactamase class C family)
LAEKGNPVRALIFATLMLVLPSGMATAQDEPQRLQALLEAASPADAPAVALGVVKDGQILFAAYRGLENLETGTPAGPLTRFNIASNAKQFTALAALDLARSGALDLDADVRDILPGSLPGISSRITTRQLIAHTSGLRDVYDLWGLEGRTWWRSFVGNPEALALLDRQTGLNFEPGTQHLYSNSNYILLTRVIEAAGGQPFADRVAAMVDRWGMTATRFATDAAVPIPHRARPYADFGSGWIEFPAVTSIHGDGWLFTTLDDQIRFETRVQAGDDPLIEAGQGPLWPTYGYGLEHAGRDGARHVWHDGSTGAQSASVSRFPDCGVSVVAMTNNGQVSTRALVAQAADLVLGGCASARSRFAEAPPTPVERVEPGEVTGVYRQANGGADIRIVLGPEGLRREIEGRDAVRLLQEESGMWVYESNPDLRMAFDRTPEGFRRLTIYLNAQPPSEAVRWPEAQPGAFDGWSGAYVNVETGARIEVASGAGGLTVQINEEETAARVLGAGVVAADGYLIRAVPGQAAAPSRLSLDGGRVRGVVFERSAE